MKERGGERPGGAAQPAQLAAASLRPARALAAQRRRSGATAVGSEALWLGADGAHTASGSKGAAGASQAGTTVR